MKRSLASLAACFAAASLLASSRPPKSPQSHFTLTVSGLISGSFEGTGPLSSARRRPAPATHVDRLAIKLRATSQTLGKLDLDATPYVTGKPTFGETGRFDISNLGAIGTVTLGKERSWINAKTGELVVEECDERHVRGHLDFKGPCKTSSRQGDCSVHAEFDVSRQR